MGERRSWLWIYIDTYRKHLLVGMSADMKGVIGKSTYAYKDIYPRISEALLDGEDVWIEYEDYA